MGLSDEAFFAQSIIFWRNRIAGFMELHGGGKPDKPLTKRELKALEERVAEEQRATPAAR